VLNEVIFPAPSGIAILYANYSEETGNGKAPCNRRGIVSVEELKRLINN
jgi:hypothetical protein